MSGLETAFVAIGAVGFLLLLLTFVLGELWGDHDFAADHAVEHGPSIDAGLVAEADQAAGAGEAAPSWLSSRVIAASVVGFGSAGYLAAAVGLPGWLCWPVAAAGFFAVGVGTYFLVLRPLASQQYNSLLSEWNYVGGDAEVTLDIVPAGIGQVTFRDRQGARVTRTARADVTEPIPRGATVRIVGLEPGVVVVHQNPFA